MRRLCDEGVRSYLGRSRLVPERATAVPEREVEVVVVQVQGPQGMKESMKDRTRVSD